LPEHTPSSSPLEHRRKAALAALLQRDATVTICHSKSRDLKYARTPIYWLQRRSRQARHRPLVKPGARVIDFGVIA